MRTTAKMIELLLITLLSACANRTFSVSVEQIKTETPVSGSLALPPTWTPSPTSGPPPTLTAFPTFTPVPPLTAVLPQALDPIDELEHRSERASISPNGQWSANVDSVSMRVVNQTTGKVWTLPCTLFEECSVINPVQWSPDSQVLYFAPEANMSEAPIGITLYTAVARIDMETGRWEKILEETKRYYDFAVSNDDTYLAYTQPAETFADNHSVVIRILDLKNLQQDTFTLDGFIGGNILWSPFTTRFVFQIQDPATGSSIVYYDVKTEVLKYITKDEQTYFQLVSWGEDNLVSVRKIAWFNRTLSDWTLNPFTNELLPVPTPS